jgi:hypothetical protein
MPTSSGEDELTAARATLHELLNALAAARVWLAVMADATKQQPALADALARVGRSVDCADECGHRLRQILPNVARPATELLTKDREEQG